MKKILAVFLCLILSGLPAVAGRMTLVGAGSAGSAVAELPVYVNKGSQSVSAPSLPGATGDFNLLVINTTQSITADPTATGFTHLVTLQPNPGNSNYRTTLLYRIQQAGDTAPTITRNATFGLGQIFAYRNVHATSPVEGLTTGTKTATPASLPYSQTSTSGPKRLVVHGVSLQNGGSNFNGSTPAAGWTKRGNLDDNVLNTHAEIDDQPFATAGLTTSGMFTDSNSWSGAIYAQDFIFALRPTDANVGITYTYTAKQSRTATSNTFSGVSFGEPTAGRTLWAAIVNCDTDINNLGTLSSVVINGIAATSSGYSYPSGTAAGCRSNLYWVASASGTSGTVTFDTAYAGGTPDATLTVYNVTGASITAPVLTGYITFGTPMNGWNGTTVQSPGGIFVASTGNGGNSVGWSGSAIQASNASGSTGLRSTSAFTTTTGSLNATATWGGGSGIEVTGFFVALRTAPDYYAYGLAFNGSSSQITRGAALTSAASSPTGSMSYWVKTANNTTGTIFSEPAGNKFNRISNGVAGQYDMFLYNGSAAAGIQLTVTTAQSNGVWRNVLISWKTDLASGSKLAHIYINDVAPSFTKSDSSASYSVDWNTITNFSIGTGGTGYLNGDLAQFYMNTNEYIDFSIEANRRKFISATGKPVSLGATCALPTGTQPIICMQNASGTAGTNSGYGGAFTASNITGATTSPSD